MTRILIPYGTTDVFDAAIANPDPAGYDGVIVAGSVHAGGYPRSVGRWVRSHQEALRRGPSAFISVCLAVLQEGAKDKRGSKRSWVDSKPRPAGSRIR